MNNFAKEKCTPIEKGAAPLARGEVERLIKDLSGWTSNPAATAITKTYSFKDFLTALSFANAIAFLAEREGHHPDLAISWGEVEITLSTHSLKGLSRNDFILAAKIDALR